METDNPLICHQCVPCQGGVSPLDTTEIHDLLSQLNNNWQVNDLGHLYKRYTFEDFLTPIKFVNSIADIVEKEGHHPELLIGWGHCSVEIWTHKINGLTPSDFYLAAKIEKKSCNGFL